MWQGILVVVAVATIYFTQIVKDEHMVIFGVKKEPNFSKFIVSTSDVDSFSKLFNPFQAWNLAKQDIDFIIYGSIGGESFMFKEMKQTKKYFR